MLEIIQRLISDYLLTIPIQFFQLPINKYASKSISGLEVPIFNSFLERERLIKIAIGNYSTIQEIDYQIELLSMCKVVKDEFNLNDEDSLGRTNAFLNFELTGEGDLNFITENKDSIRDLVIKKFYISQAVYLFPFYFVLNRTGIEVDLSLWTSKDFEDLLSFINVEESREDLEQIDVEKSIKKP